MRSPPAISRLRRTFHEWSADGATGYAAALAYYSIFSLAPLLVVIIAVTGLYVGAQSAVEQNLLQYVERTLGPSVAEMVAQLIQNIRKPSHSIPAMIISVAIMLSGAASIFGHLQKALNEIWDVGATRQVKPRGFIMRTLVPFFMLIVLAGLLMISFTAGTVVSFVFDRLAAYLPISPWFVQAANFGVTLVLLTALFALMFKILPDTRVPWRHVWTGGALTAVLFVAGEVLINLYLKFTATGSTYGAAGSVVIFLMWVYYSSLIVLFGAEFTQVEASEEAEMKGFRSDDEKSSGEKGSSFGVTAAAPVSAGLFGDEPAFVKQRAEEISARLKKKLHALPHLAGSVLNPSHLIEERPLVATSVAALTGFAVASRLVSNASEEHKRHVRRKKLRAAKKKAQAAEQSTSLVAKALGVGLEALQTYLISRRAEQRKAEAAPPAPKEAVETPLGGDEEEQYQHTLH